MFFPSFFSLFSLFLTQNSKIKLRYPIASSTKTLVHIDLITALTLANFSRV